jgi:3alpha(or 20beta)-hydroxysteroid dehydrogenase
MPTAHPVIDLNDRVAVITGASGGQGRAHARLFVELGCTVVLTDIDTGALGEIVAELGESAIALHHDVTSGTDWAAVMAETGTRFGRLDVLVNNAGYCPVASLADSDEALIRRTLDINLLGPMLGMQAALPLMSKTGGSIINISSTAGIEGAANRVPYSASKWGLRGASRSVAIEYGQFGIRVNAICPGAVDTPMISEDTRAGRGFIAGIPIPRAGRPEEISRLVAFLASDASSYCTGQDFVIDGGVTA